MACFGAAGTKNSWLNSPSKQEAQFDHVRMILLLGKPTNHYQIHLLNLLSVFSWSGPLPTQQEVSSTRVVSWSQRLSPGLKWTANRDAGSGMEAWEKFGPPRNNGRSPYLSCLQLPHSHKKWGDSNMKWKIEQIRRVQDVTLVITGDNAHQIKGSKYILDITLQWSFLSQAGSVKRVPACRIHTTSWLKLARNVHQIARNANNVKETNLMNCGGSQNTGTIIQGICHYGFVVMNYYWNDGHLSSSIQMNVRLEYHSYSKQIGTPIFSKLEAFSKNNQSGGICLWCLIHPLRLWQNHRQCRKRWMGMCCLRKHVASCQFIRKVAVPKICQSGIVASACIKPWEAVTIFPLADGDKSWRLEELR